MENTIVIETKNGEKHILENDTFIRWLCLIEIVQLTEEKAMDLKLDLDKYDWVKPIAFKKYINARFKGMEVDIEAERSSKVSLQKHINNSHHTVTYH
jgi:hypothetical protein